MKNRLYHVSRNDIHIGRVMKIEQIFSYDNLYLSDQENLLKTVFYKPIRSILFLPDEIKFANDLLYTSPSYPIISNNVEELNLDLDYSEFLVNHTLNISQLLEFFGYPRILTYDDIINIRKIYFSGHFAQDNPELFGYKKTLEHRGFELVTEGPLPSEFFTLLDQFGGNHLLGQEEKIDAFKPAKSEGRIRKLPKF